MYIAYQGRKCNRKINVRKEHETIRKGGREGEKKKYDSAVTKKC